MEVGKIYNYKKETNNVLHCGSGVYPYAVCVMVKPLILVSEEGDMTSKAFERLKRENYDCVIVEEEFES